MLLLDYARDNAPGTTPIGSSVIPCTQAQAFQAVTRLTLLCADPWFQAVANHSPHALPIARIYVPRPRSNTVDPATAPVAPMLAQLWH
jgi:hypothetical protein